ncbi:MAG: hypothetical protein DHS20C18_10720 [Saprospiraceae bacterium]|nr:MAG: hypothetical protein DHS20C18_10720 [Saprospiraceae bacterium]
MKIQLFSQSYLRKLFTISILVALGVCSLNAQKIFPISPILPDGDRNENYAVTFTIQGAPTGTTRWLYATISGAPPISGLGIDFTNANAEGGIINQPIENTANTTTPYRIRVTAEITEPDATVHNFSKDYTLVVWNDIPAPCESNTEIALVLDASGSMSGTRWTELKEAIKTYLPSLNDRVTTTNNLEVIYFQGTTATTKYNEPFSDVDWQDEADIAESIFGEGAADEVIPGGGTPMGAGINRAINGFTTGAGVRRIMIVFTDGYQNIDPRFVETVNRICNTQINSKGDRECTDTGTDLDATDVLIYTIGVGGGDQPLLEDLAHPNDSYAFDYGTANLDQFFYSTIPAGFRGCSPRIIDYRNGMITNSNDTLTVIREKFFIDSLVTNLSIRIKDTSGPQVFDDVSNVAILRRIQTNSLQLYKDGVLTPFQPIITGSVARYFIEFPVGGDTAFPDGGGEWEVRFSGYSGTTYDIAAMVEDRYFKTALEVENTSSLYAGDKINVTATPTIVNQAIDSLTVVAFLLKPGEDLGDLASRTTFDGDVIIREDTLIEGQSRSSLIAQATIDALLEDPDFLSQLAHEERIVALTRNANGAFTGSFSGNENINTGTYQLVVKYRGNLPGYGAIQHLDNRWFYVDFSRPEEIDLNLTVANLSDGQNESKQYIYTFKPTNKFGKNLGPAQAHRIKFLVDQRFITLEDKLDGTYEATFSAAPNADPQISIYVGDRDIPVYEKPLDGADKNFGLSAHSGYVQSLNSSTPLSSSDNGIYIEVDLAYAFDNNWALELIGGNYRMNNNIDFWGGALFAEYTLRQRIPGSAGFYPRIAAGVGLFKPDTQDLTVALGIRPGLLYQLTPQLEFSLDAGIYTMPGPGYLLGYAGLGLRYGF